MSPEAYASLYVGVAEALMEGLVITTDNEDVRNRDNSKTP